MPAVLNLFELEQLWLRQEFGLTMALAGCANLKAIARDLVMRGEKAASANVEKV